MHSKGKFCRMIHLGQKTTNPQLTLCCSLELELSHRIMDLLSGLKAKSIRSHWFRACSAHWSSLSSVQQKPVGTPSAPASLLQCHACILFVCPRCNYEDLHGNFLSIPRLLSACNKFKAGLPTSQGVRTELVAVSQNQLESLQSHSKAGRLVFLS